MRASERETNFTLLLIEDNKVIRSNIAFLITTELARFLYLSNLF